ncbi:hypothetical protein BCV72DRAFT_189522, partial [Rhizopus microsporus var. microsporus]
DLQPRAYFDHEGKEHSLLVNKQFIINSRKRTRLIICPYHAKKRRSYFGEKVKSTSSSSIRNIILCSPLPSLNPYYVKTSTMKGNFPKCSLSHIDTMYPNVKLSLMSDDRSKKLVLGTKTMDVLIKPSIRIDHNE